MSHGHHHHGESMSGYFTEQLLTILVCGLFGFVAVQMWRTGMLEKLLAPQFHPWVLFGGIAVLVLVVLRSIAVWKEAGAIQAKLADADCDINHTHGPECNHPHFHAPGEEHDHGHSHDMSWVFARMLVLVFPVLLFFLGLPTSSYSKERQLALAGKDSALGSELLKELAADSQVVEEKKEVDGSVVRILKTKTGLQIRETLSASPGAEPRLELISGEGTRMKFNDLNDAALDEAQRKHFEGKTPILEGRFKRLGDKEFSLFRLKMTCCATDTVPLKVRIIVPVALSNFNDFDWVQVKGQLQFVQVPGQDRYIPVIMVADIRDVQKREPKNEYEQ